MSLPVKQSTCDDEIVALRARLEPITQAGIDKVLVLLKSHGLEYPSGIDKPKLPIAYGLALRGISETGVQKAALKYIRGEYSAQSFGFMPTPPELAARSRDEERADRQHIIRLHERKNSEVSDRPIKTEESKARVREKVAAFLRNNPKSSTPVLEGRK